MDQWRDHRGLCHSRFPVCDHAGGAIRRRQLLADIPAQGLTSDNFEDLTTVGKILDYLCTSPLPIVASTIAAFATLTLLTKNSFLDEIKKHYVMTARAKGLSEKRVPLRACLPQRHADCDRRVSGGLHRCLLWRICFDRNDLLAGWVGGVLDLKRPLRGIIR